MTAAAKTVRLVGLALLAAALHSSPSSAAERELEQAPPPSSVEGIRGIVENAFLRPARKRPLVPGVKQALQDLPPFFADTEFEARFRTYYLEKDRAAGLLSEAWAIGGSLYYGSGWLADTFAVEAEGFTSQRVVAPDGRGGTGLLAPVQNGYSVLGVANAKLRYKDVVLTGFRQRLRLPYVNEQDNRMTPQTFEALTLTKEEGTFRFSTGYVWRIKRRNSERFISMAEAALVPEDSGLAYAAALYKPSEDFHIGGSVGAVADVFGGFYGEVGYAREIFDDFEVRLDGQLTYQQSVGDELFAGGPFRTWNLGLRGSTDWKGAVLRLGFSLTGDDRAIFSPWGSNPSYLDLMQRTFNQAGEKAVLVSVSYDFSRLGIPGLSVIANAAHGWGGEFLDARGDASELDLTLDYKLPDELGLFDGLWLRVRGSWLFDDRLPRTGTDFRVILRYEFPVI